MRVADYIFKRLADGGARHVFMVTGGGAMFLNDAIRLEKRLTPIFNQHEQACAMGAEGYVRAGNGMGVVNVTTGPGGTNTLTGVIGQWLDSIPVIYISGQVKFSTSLLCCPELGLRQLGDQEINIVDLVRPVTKYAKAVSTPDEVPLALEQALKAAYSGRPGPVWLDIPLNVQNAQLPDATGVHLATPKEEMNTEFSSDVWASMKTLTQLFKASKRPAFIAGHGIRLASAQEAFLALAETLQIPVLTTFNGFDLIASDHPLFCGRIGTLGNRAGNFVLQSADLLISIGSRNNIRQTSYNWENFGKNARKVVVDIDPAELRKPTIHVDLPICMDARHFIEAFHACVRQESLTGAPAWLDWSRSRLADFPLTPPRKTTAENAVDAYCFMERLTLALPSDGVAVAGNGTACVALFQSGRVKQGQRLFWNSGCASMGYDLPAAIGAAILGRKTVCIAGDGSIQMNLAELQTLVNHRLVVKIFLLENNGYASIRQTQNAFFGGQKIGCDSSSGVALPDMLRIAAAYGIRAVEIHRESDMDLTIAEVLEGDDPVLCVVHLGENEFAPKLASRTLPDGTLISSSLEDMAPFLPEESVRKNVLNDSDGDKNT